MVVFLGHFENQQAREFQQEDSEGFSGRKTRPD
jgi:hypothetical protein